MKRGRAWQLVGPSRRQSVLNTPMCPKSLRLGFRSPRCGSIRVRFARLSKAARDAEQRLEAKEGQWPRTTRSSFDASCRSSCPKGVRRALYRRVA